MKAVQFTEFSPKVSTLNSLSNINLSRQIKTLSPFIDENGLLKEGGLLKITNHISVEKILDIHLHLLDDRRIEAVYDSGTDAELTKSANTNAFDDLLDPHQNIRNLILVS